MPPESARRAPGGDGIRCKFHTEGYTEARFPSIQPGLLIPERGERHQARAVVAEFLEPPRNGL